MPVLRRPRSWTSTSVEGRRVASRDDASGRFRTTTTTTTTSMSMKSPPSKCALWTTPTTGARARVRALARGRSRASVASRAIRTTDSVTKAAAVLEITPKEARDEGKLKRAFRRAALRTHPDIAGDTSEDAFKVVQSAYRTLRAALIDSEGSSRADTVSEGDDQEWGEHDWKWRARYGDGNDPSVARKTTTEERARAVAEQLGRIKADVAEPAQKRGKRAIKPISQQKVPTPEEIAAMDSEAKTTFGKNMASRHSSNGAHDALSAQLEGLQRKGNIKARVAQKDVDEAVQVGIHYSTIKAIEDSEEERFLRLAKLAREWRAKQNTWRENGDGGDKMTAKELLQAAVIGASMGACS